MKRNGVEKWCLAAWQLERTDAGVVGSGGVGGWSTSYAVKWIMFGKYGQLWLEDVTRWRYVFEMLSFSESMNTISGLDGVHWMYRLNVDWQLVTDYIYSLIGWLEANWSSGTCLVGRWGSWLGVWSLLRAVPVVMTGLRWWWWGGERGWQGWEGEEEGGEELISYIEIRLKNTW